MAVLIMASDKVFMTFPPGIYASGVLLIIKTKFVPKQAISPGNNMQYNK